MSLFKKVEKLKDELEKKDIEIDNITEAFAAERIDIENSAIEKLGGIANFLDESVSKQIKKHTLDNITQGAVIVDHVDKAKMEIELSMIKVDRVIDLIENPPGKSFFKSKTLWANALMVGGALLTRKTGLDVSPELFSIALGVVNVILRKVTNEPLNWK